MIREFSSMKIPPFAERRAASEERKSYFFTGFTQRLPHQRASIAAKKYGSLQVP
jgi:hypothetical protein